MQTAHRSLTALVIFFVQVDSPDWYDMSPEVNDTRRQIVNTPAADVYVGR